MERKRGFLEQSVDAYNIFIVIICILGFFIWIGGCFGCHHEKPQEIKTEKRIEKTIQVLGNKWDKWLEEQNKDTTRKK